MSYVTMPKATISYKWVVKRAYERLSESRSTIDSPSFVVHSPVGRELSDSEWYLTVSRSGYYCDISLRQDIKLDDNLTVLFNHCSVSVLNDSGGVTKTSKAPVTVSHTSDIKSVFFIDKIKNKLIIKIEAEILYLNDSVETVPDDIRQQMKTMLNEEMFTDVTIKCGDKKFNVHKAMLASQSPVFKKMFEIDMKEKRDNVVEISDIDPQVMADVVDFIYTGDLSHLDTMVNDLLNAANKYGFSRLLTLCEKHIASKIDTENVIETILFADLHGSRHVKKACWDLIKCNPREVYETDGCQSLKDSSSNNPFGAYLLETLEYVFLDESDSQAIEL